MKRFINHLTLLTLGTPLKPKLILSFLLSLFFLNSTHAEERNINGWYTGFQLNSSSMKLDGKYQHQAYGNDIAEENNFGYSDDYTNYSNLSSSLTDRELSNAAGFKLGYFWDLNDVVLGLSADIDISERYHHKKDIILNEYNDLLSTKTKAYDVAHLKVLLGKEIGNFMPYVTAGVALGRVSTKIEQAWFNDGMTEQESRSFSKQQYKPGYIIGFGTNYFLDNNWFVNVEYNYTNYSNQALRKEEADIDGALFPTTRASSNISSQSVILGINFKY